MLNINFEWIIEKATEKIIQLLLLMIVFILFEKFIIKYIRRVYQNYIKKKFYNEQRTLTLYKLFESVIQYTFYFFFIATLLSILGVPVATLIAGAGIAGLVIGLGAQSFINDLVNGFFVLIEKQFDVNDLVTIGSATGRVKTISLRITTLESLDGSLFFIRNKEINIVNNLSKNSRRVLINLYFKNIKQIEKITQIITKINNDEIQHNVNLTKNPTIIGLQTSPNGALYFSVALYTHPHLTNEIQHEFYEKYIKALTDAHIEIFS